MVYGYTPSVALSLPVVQFFTLHREAREVEESKYNRTMRDLCDIVTIAHGTQERYEQMREHFQTALAGDYDKISHQERANAVDAGTEDAANAMRSFFGGLNG